jgi:CRP/FNR family transcriptional regulator, nitrogen fixation regulation protein
MVSAGAVLANPSVLPMALPAVGHDATAVLDADGPWVGSMGFYGGLRKAGSVLHFGRNRQIYCQGSDGCVLFRVVSGVVRTCKLFSDGRRQVSAFLVKGDVFGFEAAMQQSLSAEAVSDCTVAAYRWRGPGTRAVDPAIWPRQLFAHAMAGLARAERHSLLLGQGSAVAKVAAFLVECVQCSLNPKVVALPMTRQDIADYLGLTIETVSRTLSRLERNGLIKLSTARDIEVADLAALRLLGS